MRTVYLYIPDTMAEWEIGHIAAELGSGRFFDPAAEPIRLVTVGSEVGPIRTMGGLTIYAELAAEQLEITAENALILPGGDTWGEERHRTVLGKAAELLQAGGTVAAICGATVALASAGLMNDRRHTSNGAGFLDMFAPGYAGQALYVEAQAVTDRGLITAGAHGSLRWAALILEQLRVFRPATLTAWEEYMATGRMEAFMAMMGSLQG